MILTSLRCYLTMGLFLLTGAIVPSAYADNAESVTSCHVVATNKIYTCAVGKTGIKVDKKEGDSATPAGSFLIRAVFYRPDKLSKDEIASIEALRKKGFPVHAMTPDDGWSDDVRSAFYNQPISIAKYLKEPLQNPSYEKLWRDDDVYNIVAVVGYNDDPVVKGKGSAIFMHVMRHAPNGDIVPTVGCVSFAQADLMAVLSTLTPQTHINIPAQGRIITIG